jgi:hypothetical protein
MQFVSFVFVAFLPIVFIAYWLVGRLRRGALAQNMLLVLASYVFYAYWDWRLLSLLVAVSFIGNLSGWALERSSDPRIRKAVLAITLLLPLGILGYFKYTNFFLSPGPRPEYQALLEGARGYPTVHFLDLQPVFWRAYQTDHRKFEGFDGGHWSAYGDAVVARALYARLLQLGLVPSPSP